MQKNDNNFLKKNLIVNYNENTDKSSNYTNSTTFPSSQLKNINNSQTHRNPKKFNNNKIRELQANTYFKNMNKYSLENNGSKEHLSKDKNKTKETINENYMTQNRIDDNKNIFSTKYDYIQQKGKFSNGPVEIPSDLEIQRNLNLKEWNNQKCIPTENVKRSDIIKKVKIFNNKKNIDKCTSLLKKVKENEKELIVFPYAKEKQKVNKTIHAIGHSNGITYLKTSLLSGGNENTVSKRFMSIIRTDEGKNKKIKKILKLNLFQRQNNNKAQIDLNI